MSKNHYPFPEACLERIVERAIEEGKLFELLFTEEGRRLWEWRGEDKMRDLVMKKLKIKRRGKDESGRGSEADD
jgi:hypothetical protein